MPMTALFCKGGSKVRREEEWELLQNWYGGQPAYSWHCCSAHNTAQRWKKWQTIICSQSFWPAVQNQLKFVCHWPKQGVESCGREKFATQIFLQGLARQISADHLLAGGGVQQSDEICDSECKREEARPFITKLAICRAFNISTLLAEKGPFQFWLTGWHN